MIVSLFIKNQSIFEAKLGNGNYENNRSESETSFHFGLSTAKSITYFMNEEVPAKQHFYLDKF